MLIGDLFLETYSAITTNKVRTGLTILGIVIGIGSVIAMTAIGKGAQNSIEESIQSIGSNLLMIQPGAERSFGSNVRSSQGSSETLVIKDANDIKQQVSLVKAVAPEVSGRYQITAGGQNTNTSVIGTVPAYTEVRNVQVESGNFFSTQQELGLAKVAVIGPETTTTLFGEGANPVGQKIRISNVEFLVIGETQAKGGTGFGSSDDVVYIPLSVAGQFLVGDNHLSLISVSVSDSTLMDQAEEEIQTILLKNHSIKDSANADFNIRNQADIVATASSVTGTFTMLLGSVAGISLLVGGIGIMNMMLTTVTERTREIGLRKAIGAKRKDVSLQFLIEATVLTLLGGIFGTVLGWAISFGVSKLYPTLQTEITFSSVMLAFGVSAVIGIVFGYYPARRASKLNPIQALRYE